jgi:hypothetical protein
MHENQKYSASGGAHSVTRGVSRLSSRKKAPLDIRSRPPSWFLYCHYLLFVYSSSVCVETPVEWLYQSTCLGKKMYTTRFRSFSERTPPHSGSRKSYLIYWAKAVYLFLMATRSTREAKQTWSFSRVCMRCRNVKGFPEFAFNWFFFRWLEFST